MKEKTGKTNVQLTEIFTAKAGRGMKGYDRIFHGTIKRGYDNNEKPIVYGKIKVNDGEITASGKDQWELGDKLDQLVMLILDNDLHGDGGVTATNPKFKFGVNKIYMN